MPGLAIGTTLSATPIDDPDPLASLAPISINERFRQAKRGGTPAWLWPEIPVEAWRNALHLVTNITHHALAGRPAPRAVACEGAAFGLACYTSGMGPLLAWWRERNLLDASPEITALLDLHWRHNRARHRRLAAVASNIVERLATAQIPVVILKGLHTAAYFPAPGTRPMADIDLLVAQGDAAAAAAVLAAAGLVAGPRGPRETHWHPAARGRLHTLLFVHEDDPWSIDLHCSLDQFVAAGAPLARFDEAAPLFHASPLTGLPAATGLDQPLLLLHLAAHAGGTLHNLTLLRLTELFLVIRQDEAAGRLSWQGLVDIGAKIGALGYAYPALELCEALMPGTVPRWVIARCAAAAPERVRRFVRTLTPSTAQRVDRSSIAEHFMWTTGWGGAMRQLAADLVPARQSWRVSWSIYERRAWQLLRGRIGA